MKRYRFWSIQRLYSWIANILSASVQSSCLYWWYSSEAIGYCPLACRRYTGRALFKISSLVALGRIVPAAPVWSNVWRMRASWDWYPILTRGRVTTMYVAFVWCEFWIGIEGVVGCGGDVVAGESTTSISKLDGIKSLCKRSS